MKKKLEGIVIRTIKYRETSIITDVYTSSIGLQSYIVNNVRSAKSRINIALFQPLTLVSLVGYYNENKSLQRLSEITCPLPFRTLHRNIRKTAIAIYLAEFLNNILKHEEPNENLFGYIKKSLLSFDEMTYGYENFHLHFILNCARFLGIAPASSYDLLAQLPASADPGYESQLEAIMELPYTQNIKINQEQRRQLLDFIIRYFRFHIEGFKPLNSSDILHDVLT